MTYTDKSNAEIVVALRTHIGGSLGNEAANRIEYLLAQYNLRGPAQLQINNPEQSPLFIYGTMEALNTIVTFGQRAKQLEDMVQAATPKASDEGDSIV